LLAGSCTAILAISSLSYADDVPVSSCTQYLNSADSDFYSMVSSNSTTAANVAQTLDACNAVNICAQINNINNCAAVLTNRYFVSEYYAAVNGNGASGGSYGATAAASSGGSTKSNNNTDNAANTAPTKKPVNKNDSSIHWF
jgi:hypothetical protein